ncbi:MAG: DUF402 domain-containing protein [Chloroflexi bacterium]|nr:MAG: DUF402 domain-containing protein [Chloroflexota bacterium]
MRSHQIVEVKRRLDGTEARFDCEPLLVEAGRRAVILYVLDRSWQVEGIALRPGTQTYAHFWIDRPYNAYQWVDGERTVGTYFNVGPCDEISSARVGWTDYVVDILVTPDGTATVLDEGELGAETPQRIPDPSVHRRHARSDTPRRRGARREHRSRDEAPSRRCLTVLTQSKLHR